MVQEGDCRLLTATTWVAIKKLQVLDPEQLRHFPFVGRGRVRLSILLWQQNRCCTSVRFSDDPNFFARIGDIRREDAQAVLECAFVFLLVFLWDISPIATDMSIKKL